MANYPMGIGPIGSSTTVFKRKFRYTWQIQGFCNNAANEVPEYYVMTAGRPNLAIEETEINHLNAKTWIPGKAAWETITITYQDVATTDNQPLWNWLATVYNFTDPINLQMGNRIDYGAQGILNMYDGCGVLLETWTLNNVWPTAINFGEVDYSSSEIATIELTLRYSDVQYQSFCPAFTPFNCCSGCGSTALTSGSTST